MRLKNVKNASEIIKAGKYYVEDSYKYKGKWHNLFNNNNRLYIEIGMGKGDFIINNAIKYPDINFIGIEKYDSVFVRAIQKSNDLELANLKLIKMDAKNITEIFDKEVDLIYLNFSDPWPKDRHSKRRLTSTYFLERYDYIFKSKKHIIMKTDNLDLFNFSLNSLKDYGYKIIYLTNDLTREHDLNNILTEYEQKFTLLGIKINKLEAFK